jgi:hypothetical protein
MKLQTEWEHLELEFFSVDEATQVCCHADAMPTLIMKLMHISDGMHNFKSKVSFH